MTFNLNKAFRILRRNYGCPGPDEISIKDIKSNYWRHKCFIDEQLSKNLFQFSSPRFTTISTGTYSIGTRNIFVYSVFDRWVQIAIKLELEKHLKFENSVFSYRKGKNKTDALKHLLTSKPKYILVMDLKHFFESIDKTNLFERLKMEVLDKNLLQLTQDSVSHSENGLPLGNCISPLLANFYLSEIDEMYPKYFSRYSDDLFFSFDNTLSIDNTIEKVNSIITKHLHLELNWDKTFIYANPRLENIIDEFPWLINIKHRQYKL